MLPEFYRVLQRAILCSLFFVSLLGSTLSQAASSAFFQLNHSGRQGVLHYSDPLLSQAGQPVHYQLRYTYWLPGRSNGKVIIYNHGLQSHRGWFYGSAEYLAILGYTVYAFDRVGAGQSSASVSVRPASDNGSAASLIRQHGHVDRWQVWTDSLDQMVRLVRKRHPSLELNLWANSFAAHILTGYINSYPDRGVRRLVFTTPGLFSRLPLPFTIPELIAAAPGQYFASTIPEQQGDQGATLFTSDPFYQWAISTDGYSQRRFSREFYLAVGGLTQFNLLRTSFSTDPLASFPRFYLYVPADPMMDNQRLRSYLTLAPDNTVVKAYSGGDDHRHLLAFTADMQQSILDIDDFLHDRPVQGQEVLQVPAQQPLMVLPEHWL